MSKKKLNQIVAVERDIKTRAYKELSKEHVLLQRADDVTGMIKTYEPKGEGGEQYPPQSKFVSIRVWDALFEVKERQRELFDVTFTKDVGNTQTKADILGPDGSVMIKDVPVPTLLFLEKQLNDLHTFFEKLPVLDPAQRWEYDLVERVHVTKPIETIKTQKVKKAIVLVPPTKEHPAQSQLIDEDITVGTWKTIAQSGAIMQQEKTAILRRTDFLMKSVKEARERANLVDVEEQKMSDSIFTYLLGVKQS